MIVNIDFSNELQFIASRSSGAGGQHVNKVNTKVALRFDVMQSKLLNEEQKAMIHKRLKKYITTDGILQIVSQTERSQSLNKKRCEARFYKMLEKALRKPKKRIPVKPTKAMKERRLEKKKKQAEKKANRKPINLSNNFQDKNGNLDV